MTPAETAGPPPAAERPWLAEVDCVLLCAGVGHRLRPLTDSIPKALVPVAGRPILDYHLDAWYATGVRRAILVTGYRGDQVRRHVAGSSRPDLSIEFVTQREPRGSGDALLAAADHLRGAWVLVGYCDVFFGRAPSIWETLLADRRAKIVAAHVPDAAAYGRLIADEDRPWPRLLSIQEKDGSHLPGLINGGAYLLPRRVVEIVRSVGLSPRGEVELTDAVTQYVSEGGEIRIVPTSVWTDVGTPEQLETANRLAASPPARYPLGSVRRPPDT